MTADPPAREDRDELHPLQSEKALISTTSEYCVKLMVAYASLCDGDFLMAMIFLSASLGGTQHLRNRPARTEDFDGPFYRDVLRRPVSISAIARSLNVAIETVRRKCRRLNELGLLQRTVNGHVVVTTRALARTDVEGVVRHNLTALHLMLDQIDREPLAYR